MAEAVSKRRNGDGIQKRNWAALQPRPDSMYTWARHRPSLNGMEIKPVFVCARTLC